MSVIKTTLVAASLVVAVAASANAQTRGGLNSKIHGEPASAAQTYDVAPRWAAPQNARGAYAQAYTRSYAPQVRYQQQRDTNPLFDDFHGND